MKLKYLLSFSTAVSMLLSANGALAQTSTASDATAKDVETIVVYGVSSARQGQTVTQTVIELATPGTSPLKAIERLPGVNFQSADALGTYEWSTRITLRGFGQNQLGFNLDGVPLGDMSYGNHNGLHISRAIIPENVARVDVSQGAGALQTASSSNLGGTLLFTSAKPSETFGGQVNLTYGSDNLQRIFGRVESGTLEAIGGGAASLSFAATRADKWKGVGEQNQDQINLKYVQPIGSAKVTFAYNWSDRAENDYQDFSLEMIRRLGPKWDNISGQYPIAVLLADIRNNNLGGTAVTNAAAGTIFPAPTINVDDAYFDASGLRKDNLAYLSLEMPVEDNVTLKATAYSHTNEGQGTWFTPYLTTPAGAPDAGGAPITNPAPLSVRTTEYDINRTGLFGSLNFDWGKHQASAGIWLENNEFNQARRFYGLARAANNRPSLEFMTNPFFTQWAYEFNTNTIQFWAQDIYDVTDDLTVNFGFKALKVTNEIEQKTLANAAPANPIKGKIRTNEIFLPQIGFTYDLNPTNQFFSTYSRNVAAFVSAATAGPFASQSQAVINEVGTGLLPEESTTFELGWRTKGAKYEAAAAAYVVQFENRILAVAQGAGIVGNAPVLSNVGGVNSYGGEFTGRYELMDNLDLFGSVTYNNSEYADNVKRRDGSVVTATKGKTVVNTPEWLVKGDVTYDDGNFFAKLGASYTGERYFTFLNDDVNGKVDAYTLIEATVGYRFTDGTLLKGVEAQINVTNAADEDYVSTIGSNGFGNTGDSATLLIGAPQQVVFTLKKAF
jgi:iron complex outermembrane recepter protein